MWILNILIDFDFEMFITFDDQGVMPYNLNQIKAWIMLLKNGVTVSSRLTTVQCGVLPKMRADKIACKKKVFWLNFF